MAAESNLLNSTASHGKAAHSGPQESIVNFRERPKGFYVTRIKAIVFIASVTVVLTLVALLTAYLGRASWCKLEQPSADEMHTNGSIRISTERNEIESNDKPSYPWTDIRLPDTITPKRYRVELKVDLTHFSFSGSVRIDMLVKKRTKYIIFNTYTTLNISATSIRVQDSETMQDCLVVSQFLVRENQQYILELAKDLQQGKRYILEVGAFGGPIMRDLRGLYLCSYKTASGTTRYLAASQLQSTDARKVFPCFDEPHLKARFLVTIIHQKEYRALSNMPIHRSHNLDKGWVKSSFQETPIMSTYLLAFVVSDFGHNEAYIDQLKLRVWAQPDMLNQTQFSLGYAVKTYRFFTDYFGVKEVVPKTDHVAVPDFSGGAMENWGLVIYRETSLLYDPQASSSSDMYMVTLIVAHEIAHTWFGNMVTMKWWEDLWLNEGFASTLMYFAMDDIYPDWNVFSIMVAEAIFPVMVSDSLEASHPVSTRIDHPDDIIQTFDMISYNKGMAILRMLKGFLGWQQFRRGLQNYIKKYKFKNAEMRELWETFSEAVDGRYDVGEIMDTWTRQMGYPVVTVVDQGNKYLLEQDRFLLNSEAQIDETESPYDYKWFIPFTYKTEDDTSNVKTEWMNLSAWVNKASDGWLLGNVDYDGFYRVNYDDEMWGKLTKQLQTDHTVISQSNRAGLIDDAMNLARAGLLDYNVALKVSTYLHKDNSYVPWRAFNDNMEVIRGILTTTETYGMLEHYLKGLVTPVFDEIGVNTSGSLPERYLQRLILDIACRVGVKSAVEYAQREFKDWMENEKRLPSDYALTIYSVGIREGGEAEWNYLWKKSVETNVPTEQTTMLEALAQSRQIWILWRYVSWVFDHSMIDVQDVRLLFGFLAKNPVGRMVVKKFVMDNWEKFIRTFEFDWFSLREIIPHFTAYISSRVDLEELETMFKNHPPSTAKKAAASSLALIRTNIRWMETSYPVVASWLKHQVGPEYAPRKRRDYAR